VLIYVVAYAIALLAFAAIDITWLMTFGAQLYKSTLGDILEPNIRLAPAIAFYLLFPAGIVVFAADPAIKQGSLSTALVYGALFGLFTYGTYELTNFATLRNWTFGIAAIDIAYGVAASAIAAALTYSFAPAVARWFGS
jgi:uncharacterized membrane protein